MTPVETRQSATVERTVMLTDAVVAIAMTLLVLPLVESVPEVDLDDVPAFVGEHRSLFISFVVSFLVILLFWAAHQRVFRVVGEMTPGLKWLNAAWLLIVAFLPFPTALIGREPTTSTTPVYIGTVFALALASTAMTYLVYRAADAGPDREYLRRRVLVAAVAALVLLGCTVVAMASPDIALFALIGIAAVRFAGDRWSERVPGRST